VPAPPAIVGVLHPLEVEVRLPVRALFVERDGAETGLDPLHAAVRLLPGLRHVVLVLVPRDRPAAERPVRDGAVEGRAPPWLDASGDEIAHDAIFAF